MNLARARVPEFRPSTNTSIGRIEITDPQALLKQKTDRTGFIEDEAFREVKRFATDALNWMAHRRLAEAERKRQSKRVQAPSTTARAKQAADAVVRNLPPKARAAVEGAIKRLEDARDKETAALREDLQLYRTLGTVGTTVAVFSHESAKPVTQIEKMASVVDTQAQKSMGNDYPKVERPLDLIKRAARSLRTFAALPIALLQREKRRSSQVDLNQVVSGLAQSFSPFADESGISLELLLSKNRPLIRGSVASVEAIATNLVTNAINAIRYDTSSPARPRRIEIETSEDEADALIVVRDSGPGIVGLELDEIWLPGRTTTPGGTGLGLTIVKDAVIDLAGHVDADPAGALGGAQFTVSIPRLQ
jgi:C4-dicarboxylate-specific signal transduction histidine kinase